MSWILLALGPSSCASTTAPPLGSEERARRLETGEASLRTEAQKEESALAKTASVYSDPALQAYLEGVAARVAPAEMPEAGAPATPSVTVLLDPRLNAFAMPDGHLYVHTGLLARLDNEAQLAAVLAHELTHASNHHALRFGRAGGNWPAASTAGVFGGRDLPLALLAAVAGYGRDLEHEADAEGLARLIRAGYDPREAPRAYQRLGQDRGDPVQIEVFFFGNPAKLGERVTATRKLLEARAGGGAETNAAGFAQRTRVAVRDNAFLDVRAGRFELARAQLDQVEALAPEDPVTQLAYGDLYRLQAQRARRSEDEQSLLGRARAAYERAVALDPSYADPFRQLGLLYYQAKDNDKARAAFAKYLSLKPDAPDAARIREYAATLGDRP